LQFDQPPRFCVILFGNDHTMIGSSINFVTLNTRYAHTAIGLHDLYANLHELQPQAIIEEFTIKDQPTVIVEKLLQHQPRIIGLGVYI